MATSAGRAKRDREKARQERQAVKRARRQSGRDVAPEVDDEGTTTERPAVSQDELLSRLADLHRKFGDGEIGFDDFETAKEELLRDLEV